MSKFIVVILAGGSGNRLWPLSRTLYPKQFLALTDEHFSMFQLTVKRVLPLYPDRIIIISNKNGENIVREQMKQLELPINYTVISEPVGRNTAPAIATACLTSKPEDTLLVIPCDHLFDDEGFRKAIRCGLSCKGSNIILLGIKPTYPETGYGYVKTDHQPISDEIYLLEKFVEKPSLSDAQHYLNSGNYWWNAGVFLFNNQEMLSQLQLHQNKLLEQVKGAIEPENNQMITLHNDKYAEIEDISIDYAVMEHYNSGIVIAYNSTWSDIGSFRSLHSSLDKNSDGNVILHHGGEDQVINYQTQDCLVYSDRGLVTTIGLKDVLIVQQRDALLVADLSSSQEVKTLVNKLKSQGRQELQLHSKVFRPWGWYETLDGDDYSGHKVKRIVVYPKQRLSLQSHKHRSEHWVITRGKGLVEIDDQKIEVKSNETVTIPKGARHRMSNPTEKEVEFIETQIGGYLGEDDIIRYQDDYGRAK